MSYRVVRIKSPNETSLLPRLIAGEITGVDTRGALGAEAPPPPDFQVLYYTLYIGSIAKIIGLRPKL